MNTSVLMTGNKVTDLRTQRSRFAKQASWLAGGRVIAAGVSAVWFIVLARSLSLDEFGSLALLLSLGLMMSIVTDLGLTGLLSDDVAAHPERARLGTRIVVKKRLVLSCIASLLTAVAYLVASGAGGLAAPAVLAISTCASSACSTYTAVFRACGHAGYEGANEALSRVAVLGIGSAVVVVGGGSLIAIVAVYAFVDVMSLLVLSVVFLRTTSVQQPVPGFDVTLREARSLAVAGIVSTFYFRIDSWLLALVKGERVVGRYAAAYRCFDALLLPAIAVSSLSIPHTNGLHGRALRDRMAGICAFSAAVTAPFAVATFFAAEPLIDFVFGHKYQSASTALQILALGAIVTAAIAPVLPSLALRTPRVAMALGLSLVLNVVANLIVIPSYGATGAAAVTVGCEVTLAVWLATQLAALVRSTPTWEPA